MEKKKQGENLERSILAAIWALGGNLMRGKAEG